MNQKSNSNLNSSLNNKNKRIPRENKTYKYNRRDDSIELFNSNINHSNCNITKSFESSMAVDNDYSQQRYQTILNSTNDNKYFSDGNKDDDNAHSFIGKLQDIKSALNNSKRLVDSFDNNCIDYDIDEINGSYQDLRQSQSAHHQKLIDTSKTLSNKRDIPKGIMSTKSINKDHSTHLNDSKNHSITRFQPNHSKIDISEIRYDHDHEEDYKDYKDFSGGYYHNNEFRNRSAQLHNQ